LISFPSSAPWAGSATIFSTHSCAARRTGSARASTVRRGSAIASSASTTLPCARRRRRCRRPGARPSPTSASSRTRCASGWDRDPGLLPVGALLLRRAGGAPLVPLPRGGGGRRGLALRARRLRRHRHCTCASATSARARASTRARFYLDALRDRIAAASHPGLLRRPQALAQALRGLPAHAHFVAGNRPHGSLSDEPLPRPHRLVFDHSAGGAAGSMPARTSSWWCPPRVYCAPAAARGDRLLARGLDPRARPVAAQGYRLARIRQIARGVLRRENVRTRCARAAARETTMKRPTS
jgi:hypothetical protein